MPGRAQTHKPGLVPGGLDRTKMFHVKHLRLGPKTLQGIRQRPLLQCCKIDQFPGPIPEARRRRLDGLAGLREVIPDVRFADRIEVVTRDARAAALECNHAGKIWTTCKFSTCLSCFLPTFWKMIPSLQRGLCWRITRDPRARSYATEQ
jgi:hypothetical protein